VAQSSDQPGSTVRWWCIQFSGFRFWEVDVDEYEILPFRLDDILRVPPNARETLCDAITAEDFGFVVGLPNNPVQGPGVPFKFIRTHQAA
jgi:hypothetical protein